MCVIFVFAGAAAWVLDQTETLDEILVNSGSHVVLDSDTAVSNVIGDGRSMTTVAPYRVLTIGHDMTTHTQVDHDAVLNLTTSSIVIGELLFVNGRLDSTPNAKITLAKPAKVYFQPQDLTISELVIEDQALLKVIGDNSGIFNLSVETLEIHGEFIAGPIDFFDLVDFSVGTNGNVEFDPVDDDEHLGENIEIRGTVTLESAVSFKRPCETLLIDLGKLTYTTVSRITLECRTVVINGPFSPGNVNFGQGIEDFSVGMNGTFTFTAHGSIFMDGASISGTLNLQNYGEFMSKNGTNGIINYFIVHPPVGKVYLHNAGKPGYDSNGDETNETCSTIRVENLIVNGVLSADTLSIGDAGITWLNVDDYGDFTFTPCGDYRIHEIYVNGSMISSTPIVLRGTSLEKVHKFDIDTHGSVKFDNRVLASKSWSNSSKLGIHDIEIAGIFHAGRMVNRIALDGAWDRLSILKGGKFYFEPDGDFLVDDVSLNGIFQAYKSINIMTKRPEQDLHIFLGSYANVNLESPSYITAKELRTSTNSYFNAKETKLQVTNLIIGGRLLIQPSEPIDATYFEVTNTGSVDISNTVDMFGQTLTVRGTMDVRYKDPPEDTESGSMATNITYDGVTVSGSLKAGSMMIESNTLSVTGTLDVTGGGFKADKGPG